MSDRPAIDELTDDERAALEDVERGLESFHRAHGALVEFHHRIGRGIDHFDDAEDRLADENDDLADRLREDVVSAGVTEDGKLTYELVAEFETGLLADVESIGETVRDDVGDGRRYPIERAAHDERDGST